MDDPKIFAVEQWRGWRETTRVCPGAKMWRRNWAMEYARLRGVALMVFPLWALMLRNNILALFNYYYCIRCGKKTRWQAAYKNIRSDMCRCRRCGMQGSWTINRWLMPKLRYKVRAKVL